ncbi:MAG TPA: Maf family nucleotide pyrophosphatase [Paralcaligenes sp.]
MRLILASSSRYRRQLLTRLHCPFDVISPNIDETPLPGEVPRALALRLSAAKANAVTRDHPDALVIGSDQVAAIDGAFIGKPGTFERAQAQLRLLSGRTVEFHSGLCVSNGARHESVDVITECRFRRLSPEEIDAYLRLDEPFDAAGSAKAEGLGICLMESIQSDDPTAIIGLPLIALSRLLRSFGLNPLTRSEAS